MDRSTACCDVRLDRAVERAQALLAELSSLLDHVTSCRHVLDVQKLQELHAQAVQTGACVRNLFNTTLTVNRLPAEVLSHVFSFLPRKLRLSIAGTELGNATSVTSLLPALSVCRLWRNVALDTSSLWNTVIESRSRYHLVRQNFAKRCLGGPLHVIAIPLPRSSRLLDTVHAQASRIQELRLKIGDVSVSVQVLLLSMPALLHCCIGGYQHEVRPANKHVVRKTFPLLPDSSGSLRTLRLECTPFIPRTAFTRLTSFQLVGVGCSYRLTLFLAFLAGTPNLRYVQLDHMAFIAPPNDVRTGQWEDQPVRLDHLKELIIQFDWLKGVVSRSEQVSIRQFVGYLSFPQSCVVAMHGQGLGEIPATLERIWGGQSTFNVTQALIRTSRNADLIIHLHNDKNSLNAVFGPQGHVTNTDLGATFNAEPLSANIRKLWIQEIWGDVCPILASLPSLEFLFIEPPLPGSPPSELALTEVSKHLSVQEKRPIALPSLSTLAIFARHYEVPSKCGLPANHQLNDVQRARADAGHPIRRLFIATDRSTGSAVCHEHDERGVLMRRMIPTGRAKEELVSEWRRGTNWTSHEGLVQTDTTWSLDN